MLLIIDLNARVTYTPAVIHVGNNIESSFDRYLSDGTLAFVKSLKLTIQVYLCFKFVYTMYRNITAHYIMCIQGRIQGGGGRGAPFQKI